jgi:predicted DNA-binding transcriptional regulator AlpA
MMRRTTAAAYCDLSSTDFEREVSRGRLPAPVQLGSELHWARDQLDTALDRLIGSKATADWRKQQPGLADAA